MSWADMLHSGCLSAAVRALWACAARGRACGMVPARPPSVKTWAQQQTRALPDCMCPLVPGGDLCAALPRDDSMAWYQRGHRLALDVTRALHFLHSHEVYHSACS